MKQNRFFFFFAFLISVSTQTTKAQMVLSGELRPKTEFRHGLKQLSTTGQDAAFFVSQRTRLNLNYTQPKYRFSLSLQDVRVWGDVKQLNLSDKNQVALHQAWGELLFSDKISLKLGRQELVYDDSRILGNVGWAQQARSHDIALIKTQLGSKNQFHLGFAINNDKETLSKQSYQTSYKNMQLAWYHHTEDQFKISLLLLNVGLEEAPTAGNKTYYSQTFGTYFSYTPSLLNIFGSVYGQTGKNKLGEDLTAYMFDINIQYPLAEKWKATAGLQYLSGTDGDNIKEDNSFTPLFGTNHKFNGHMDYFYVGNHVKNVGLIDINATINYSKDKFLASLTAHIFSSQAKLYDINAKEMDAYLGNEIDLSCTYKYSKDVSFKVGYSQMFASESMETLKKGDASEIQNWAWLMVVFKPTFFSQK